MGPFFGGVGSLINERYQLVERFRASGMSSVFKAWDNKEQYSVVVKIATNNSKYSNLVECLKREAVALKRINNLRVVRLLDCGDIGESYFVVLEYIHGMDLEKCLACGSLPLDICISVGIDVLEGLKAIHEEGMVHRDLKPENLIATRIGVKIIDFGLVISVPGADQEMMSLSNSGTAVGTLPYLSPEQARGFSNLDSRSDLYACGIVLYELMTGVVPFYEFEKEGKMFWYFDLPLRPFSAVWPEVNIPDKVQAIVWKALAVNPDLRYQTAEEMRTALLGVLGSYSKIMV